MRRVKYLGYIGNPRDPECAALGLVPGQLYDVVKTERCCDIDEDETEGCTQPLPFVRIHGGDLYLLCHEEFEEVEETPCRCDLKTVIMVSGCKCGGA